MDTTKLMTPAALLKWEEASCEILGRDSVDQVMAGAGAMLSTTGVLLTARGRGAKVPSEALRRSVVGALVALGPLLITLFDDEDDASKLFGEALTAAGVG